MVRVVLLLMLMLAGCSSTDRATKHLQKAKKHIAKAVALGAQVKADTTYITKEIITPVYQHDTVVKVNNFRDTIRIENERIAWKVKVNEVTRQVYVQATCKPDTVKVEVPVLVNQEIKSGYTRWDLILLAIVALVVGSVLAKLFWK